MTCELLYGAILRRMGEAPTCLSYVERALDALRLFCARYDALARDFERTQGLQSPEVREIRSLADPFPFPAAWEPLAFYSVAAALGERDFAQNAALWAKCAEQCEAELRAQICAQVHPIADCYSN